jgi:hypothetical protein
MRTQAAARRHRVASVAANKRGHRVVLVLLCQIADFSNDLRVILSGDIVQTGSFRYADSRCCCRGMRRRGWIG